MYTYIYIYICISIYMYTYYFIPLYSPYCERNVNKNPPFCPHGSYTNSLRTSFSAAIRSPPSAASEVILHKGQRGQDLLRENKIWVTGYKVVPRS